MYGGGQRIALDLASRVSGEATARALVVLLGAIALGRIGIRAFWVPVRREPPRLRVIEVLPIAGLLALTVAITVQAGPVMRYLDDAALALRVGDDYTRSLLSAPRIPSPPQAPAPVEAAQ